MDPIQLFGSGYEIPVEESTEIDDDLDSYLAWGRKNLNPQDYVTFEIQLRRIARELKGGASKLQQLNQLPLEVASDIQQARSLLHQATVELTKQSVQFTELKASVNKTRGDIDSDIDRMGEQLAQLDIQAKLDDDPLWAYKKDKIAQNMAVAQMGAFVAEKVGEAMKWTVKQALGCTKGSVNEHTCRQALDFTKEVGKQALDLVGLKEPVKKAVEAVTRTPEPLVQELDVQFGIPRELAEEYAHNALTTTLTFAIPPTLKLAGGVTRTAARGFSAVKDGLKPKATPEFRMPKGPPTIIEGEFYDVNTLPAPQKKLAVRDASLPPAKTAQPAPKVTLPTFADLFGEVEGSSARGTLTLKGDILHAHIDRIWKDSFSTMAKLQEVALASHANTLRVTADFVNTRLLETWARRYGEPTVGTLRGIRDLPQDSGVLDYGVYAAFDIPVKGALRPQPSVTAKELSLVRKQHSRSAEPASVPKGLPQDVREFYQHDAVEYWPQEASIYGFHMPFKVSYVTASSESALFLFEKTPLTTSAERFLQAGNAATFQTAFKDEIGLVLTHMREFASRGGISRLYVAYNQDNVPLLSSAQIHPVPIINVGDFVDPLRQSTLTLLEIGVEQEVATPLYPYTSPIELYKTIDKAAAATRKGPTALHALQEVDADELLPLFPLQTTQADLWRKVISKHYQIFTKHSKFEYIRSDTDKLVVKVSDRGYDCIVKDNLLGGTVLSEFQGLHFLTSLQLKHITLPVPIAAGRYVDGACEQRYFICKTFTPGITFKDAFEQIGKKMLGSQARVSHLQQFEDAWHTMGKALGEFQTKGLQRNRSIPHGLTNNLSSLVDEAHKALTKIGLAKTCGLEEHTADLTRIVQGFAQAPGKSSFGFGDLQADQFVWTESNTPSIAFIDTEYVTDHIGTAKQGIEPLSNEYYHLHYMILNDGLQKGLTLEEVNTLQQAFTRGYATECKEALSDAAGHFFDVYYALDAIESLAVAVAEHNRFVDKQILTKLIKQFKDKLDRVTAEK